MASATHFPELPAEKVMIAAVEKRTVTQKVGFRDCFTTARGTEPRTSLSDALTVCLAAGIEVVSELPDWVELRVPCNLEVLELLRDVPSPESRLVTAI